MSDDKYKLAYGQAARNVLSGLSRLMGPGPSNTGKHFKQFVRQQYPWHLEPVGAFRSRAGTDALYDRFRNSVSHDLGLPLESTTTAPGRLRARFATNPPYIGVRKEASLDMSKLATLDEVMTRPAWLRPTE